MRKERATGALECSYCNKEFKFESDRKRHEISHNPQFSCNICGKSFSFVSALRRHEKQHARTGSVTCDTCNKKFGDETLLLRHINYAHKGSYKCEKCMAVFSSAAALRTHTITHKPESERKYRCSYDGCRKSFNFPHHLKNHELTHTDKKKYFCNVCGKGFIQAQNLKHHLNTHDPDALLCCTEPQCSKKFASEYSRKKHMAVHEINENVLCPSCGDMVARRKAEKHLVQCRANKTGEVANNNESNEVKEDTIVSNKVEASPKGNYCKTALGSCIVSGEAEMTENCLCAQMSTDVQVLDNKLDEIFQNDSKSTSATKDTKQCHSCDCGKPLEEITVIKPCKGSMPSLEFRSDGVIKLRETIDANIPFVGAVEQDRDIIPNSCKAVLGNCIVSGDGTIGEGCLCARMSKDANQASEQEITELIIDAFD